MKNNIVIIMAITVVIITFPVWIVIEYGKDKRLMETSIIAVDNAGHVRRLQVIRIDGGYTYFKGTDTLAPTPETIKQCIREVLEEQTKKEIN